MTKYTSIRASLNLLLAACLLFVACADKPPMSRTTSDTPRVLLIGDSISIGYADTVRTLLDGVAEVHGLPIATKSSTRGLAEIDSHLNKMEWDLVHFNWGLNDLEQDAPGEPRVSLERYEKNLSKLLSRLKNTGAVLIWASTTPVPQGASARTPGDAAKYNAVAATVMQNQNVLFNDLYAFALPRLETIQQKADVHFTKKGYAVLAEEVARHVKRALPSTVH